MRLLISALVMALFYTSAPAKVLAQDGSPIADLKSALDVTSWDSSEQGVILAIGPDKVHRDQAYTQDGELDDSGTLYPPRPGHTLRLATVARYFDRRVVRLATVSVVVPPEMIVLNTHLKEPDIYQGMQDTEKLELLEATLSQAQWQLLGSPDGIGVDDLSTKQAPLLESMLPDATAIVKAHSGVGTPSSQMVISLSKNDTEKIRLRLDRTSNFTLLSAAGKQTAGFVGGLENATERTYFSGAPENSPTAADMLYGQPLRLRVPNKLKTCQIDFAIPALDVSISTHAAKTVGDLVNLIRAKSGLDIYVDGRLGKQPVYLRGGEQGARAGDLLQALCLALTGTIRKIGPIGKGANADFAYVLTNDIEGLGARRARISAWAHRAQQQKSELTSKQMAEIAKQDPLQYFTMASDDPMAPTPEIMHQIETSWSAPDYRGGYEADVPIGQLTSAQRDAVRAGVQRTMDQQDKYPRPGWIAPDPGKVRVHLMLEISWVVPGFGTVRSGESFMNSSLIPESKKFHAQPSVGAQAPRAAPVPVLLRNAGIAVAPKSAGETAAIMDLAKTKGIQQVWIQAADNAAGHALLEDAVAAGKAHDIAVYALIALMAAPELPAPKAADDRVGAPKQSATDPASSSSNDLLDLNLLGETGTVAAARLATEPAAFAGWPNAAPTLTGDILAPEADGTLALETERLTKAAAISGLSGICLKETSEPGHQAEIGRYRGFPGAAVQGGEFGYTVANRLRFLREQGYDPIDLPTPQNGFVDWQTRSFVTLPFFDTDDSGAMRDGYTPDQLDPNTLKAWKSLTSQVQTAFIHNLFIRTQKLPEEVPIYFGTDPGSYPVSQSLYTPWKDILDGSGTNAAVVPAAPTSAADGPKGDDKRAGLAFASYELSPQTLVNLPFVLSQFSGSRTSNPTSTRKVGPGMATTPAYRPVLDFTAMPVSQVISLLQNDLADAANK